MIITIMVLEMKAPHGTAWSDLRPLAPVFMSYVLSFIFIGTYWSNHHHLLQASHRVSAGVMWANLHLLFWLSLTPFATNWMGETGFATLAVAVYGALQLLAAIAFVTLMLLLVRLHGPDSALARALAADYKGKISMSLYAASVPLAFVNRWVSCGIFVFVAGLWLVPDRRMERAIAAK